MLKKLLFIEFFLLISQALSSQEITGKIIDFTLQKAVENVAIQTSKDQGTVSDANGHFTISIKNVSHITFSKIGFETKTISLNEFKKLNFTVALKEKSTQLKGFQLNISKVTLDSLLVKTERSMQKNFVSYPIKSNFYVSENQIFDFNKLELKFKSSSLLNRNKEKLAKKELQNFADRIKKSDPDIPKVFIGRLETKKGYSEKLKKNFLQKKTDSVLGFKVLDSSKTFSLKKLENEAKQLVLKYLDKNKTYKVKTGLFKVEDSISFGKAKVLKDSVDLKNSFTDFKTINYMNVVYKRATFFKYNNETNFLNTKYYKHQLLDNEFLKDGNQYVIYFKPRKSKAKYEGKIYINPEDFTISKVNYQFAKGKKGESLNLKLLLGVKYSENKQTGTLLYQKNQNNEYYLAYSKEVIGRYTYVNRPFKFIENSKEKNKIKFSIKLEFNMNEVSEIFFSNYQIKKENTFSTPTEKGFYMKRLYYKDDFQSTNILQKRQQELAHFLNEYQ
jgi:hypothetical protein